MHTLSTTLSPELLFGVIISVILHGVLWPMHGSLVASKQAEIQIDAGRTSVELTLMPSIASVAPKKLNINTKPIVEKISFPSIASPKDNTPQIPEIIEPLPPDESVPPEEVQKEEKSEDAPAPTPQPISIDQDGAMDLEKGALLDAEFQSPCHPVYPRLSRRRGEEGTVVLAVDVSKTGKGSNIQIIKSSGYKRLDQAAITAIKKARFQPATRFGRPIESTLTQPFNFRLTDAP